MTTTEPARRPWTVIAAAVLLVSAGAVRAVALFGVVATIPVLPVLGLVAFVISVYVAVALIRGRRGTGTIGLVVLGLGVLQALVTAAEPDPTTAALALVDVGLSLLGIAALLLPPTRRFVGRRDVAPAYSGR